jgi:predicted CopG family antitoxin
MWHNGNADSPMSAEKRIRVSEERREQLHGMKEVGESYDDVLAELIQEHNRRELAERMREVDEMDADEMVPLDDDE